MSKKGTPTFVMQRASAVILAPLAIWFLWSLTVNAGDDFTAARAWLSDIKNALLLGALIVVGAFHMRIGMQEIIDDYIHGRLRGALLALNWLAAIAIAAVTLLSIATVAF